MNNLIIVDKNNERVFINDLTKTGIEMLFYDLEILEGQLRKAYEVEEWNQQLEVRDLKKGTGKKQD